MAVADIYEARANKGQHNGGLLVNPGSPVMQSNWGSGYNVSYGKDSNLLSKPTITGVVAATGLGQYLNAISGQYDTRLDDPRYYTSSSSG